jgi:FkbM family methyltransferase
VNADLEEYGSQLPQLASRRYLAQHKYRSFAEQPINVRIEINIMRNVLRKLRSMTLSEAELRVHAALTPFHPLLQRRLMGKLIDPRARAKLNQRYLNFTQVEKAFFHSLYCKAFRERTLASGYFEWTVDFLGKRLKMPIHIENLWLDWDLALAITGHDIEVKLTYETLMRSNRKPRVFFDVGANYGTHSMLFLAHGLEVTSFEPNASCHRIFRRMCEINGLVPNIEAAAVSNVSGKTAFWFPEREKWLGTMDDKTMHTLELGGFDLQKIDVVVTSLDDYVRDGRATPDVIKIDTEGNELKVLQGALQIIDSARPFIIFESNTLGGRLEMWRLLNDHSYIISALPILDLDCAISLTAEEFGSSVEGNFIALPTAKATIRQIKI